MAPIIATGSKPVEPSNIKVKISNPGCLNSPLIPSLEIVEKIDLMDRNPKININNAINPGT